MTQPSTPGTTDELAAMLKGLIENAGGLPPSPIGPPQPVSFEDALGKVDPNDSEAALAMLDFLLKTNRLGRVGVLDGGQGYLFVYQEPKGTTKAGYKPGATQGDRIVDQAVDKQRESGAVAAKKGMCPGCYSIVQETPEGIRLDDNGNVSDPFACSGGGKHTLVG